MISAAWLARVRHDLCKRLLWPAKDRQALGGGVEAGELVVTLIDEEGAPIGAAELWARLASEAPAGTPAAALEAFEGAVIEAVEAAGRNELGGVLALEGAFAEL